ncbi:MAG: hypothetical protein ACRCSF_08290 [Mycobacteriaceae bacterium]
MVSALPHTLSVRSPVGSDDPILRVHSVFASALSADGYLSCGLPLPGVPATKEDALLTQL